MSFFLILSSLLAVSSVSANWHTETTNTSFTPSFLRSKTVNFRGLTEFDRPLQRRQSCAIGFTTCGEGCCKIGNFCCEDKRGCCPIAYTCVIDGCCPIGKTCGGFKECPTNPKLAQCASGDGCCPPGLLCVYNSTGGLRCEGEPSSPPAPPPPPPPPSDDAPESSTSSTPSPSSGFSLPTIPPPPSDGSFPTFTPPVFPTGPVSGDDGNSSGGDDGGLSLGGDTDGALRARSSAVLVVIAGLALAL
ncbi:hypothetical protein AURDEDRAFT_188471 [Auricularia subglabra TFB-10046 SS5]|nr:hypothetical protein AURDEDRAFT_188471 [Auricularia subglabra TFB-10046 SS5]